MVIDLRRVLAINIKKSRLQLHISQEKLAEIAGISTGYVAELENARRFPSADVFPRLAEALKIDVFELLMTEDTVQKYQEFLDHQHLFEIWAERLIETVNKQLHKN